MDPETQAGTDRDALKEQARQAMLRAQTGLDESTDAELEDDDTDEVADLDADDVTEADEDEDADEAESTDEDEDEASAEDDGDSADDDKEPAAPTGNKRKKNKVVKLHEKIEALEAKLAAQTTDVSAEVERALAAKAESDAALAAMQAEQAEGNQRIKQVRDYVQRLRGTDQELDALTREIASADDLDPLALSEDQRKTLRNKKARVQQILSARDIVDLTAEYADNDLRDRVGSILAEFAKSLPGVDKDFHNKLKFGPAIQHIYDAAYERGKADNATATAAFEKKIADLEGKLLSAKTQKAPPMKRVAEGGASIPAQPKPRAGDATPMDNLKSMGAIDPKTGRVDPEFRRKLRLGQITLAG